MHLRVNLKIFGEILVHPVRRQNFAGTGAPYILQHLRLCHIRPGIEQTLISKEFVSFETTSSLRAWKLLWSQPLGDRWPSLSYIPELWIEALSSFRQWKRKEWRGERGEELLWKRRNRTGLRGGREQLSRNRFVCPLKCSSVGAELP